MEPVPVYPTILKPAVELLLPEPVVTVPAVAGSKVVAANQFHATNVAPVPFQTVPPPPKVNPSAPNADTAPEEVASASDSLGDR